MTGTRRFVLSLSLFAAGCAGSDPTPTGDPIPVPKQWHGNRSRMARPFCLLLSTEANWKALLARMFDGMKDGPAGEDIDFARERVLALSDGDAWNCDGITPGEVREDADRILLRVHHHYYQTGSGFGEAPAPEPQVRPYGLFVLPRRERKLIVIEYNVQDLLGHPPIWKEKFRLTPAEDPARELDSLPK